MEEIKILQEKLQQVENLEVKLSIPLKEYTSFKVGGPADIFLTPKNIKALQQSLKYINNSKLPFFLLGKGTNIIASDRGFRGIIIYTGQLNKLQIKGNKIISECGANLSTLAAKALEAGLSGLEFASSIPGSLGGAIFMNAGAYGSEIKNIIDETTLLDHSGQKITMKKKQLDLSYRHSILQEKPLITVRATLNLEQGNKNKIKTRIKELNKKRRKKQPLTWPSAGSTFKRPPNHYSGPLIEKANMKGNRIGDAQVSEKHAGFIINRGNATANDIYQLIKKVQSEVYETSQVKLKPEPCFLGKFET